MKKMNLRWLNAAFSRSKPLLLLLFCLSYSGCSVPAQNTDEQLIENEISDYLYGRPGSSGAKSSAGDLFQNSSYIQSLTELLMKYFPNAKDTRELEAIIQNAAGLIPLWLFRTYQIEDVKIEGNQAQVVMTTRGLSEQSLLSELRQMDADELIQACEAQTEKESGKTGVIMPEDADRINLSCLYTSVEEQMHSVLMQQVQDEDFITQQWLTVLDKDPKQGWIVTSMKMDPS